VANLKGNWGRLRKLPEEGHKPEEAGGQPENGQGVSLGAWAKTAWAASAGQLSAVQCQRQWTAQQFLGWAIFRRPGPACRDSNVEQSGPKGPRGARAQWYHTGPT
jgi:hypothetical protein